MTTIKEVRERGYDTNVARHIELTKTDSHPNGQPPWAGDATDEEMTQWQVEYNETGELPEGSRLTKDEQGLARWISYTERMAEYEDENDAPVGLRTKAHEVWDRPFKEPGAKKSGKRRQTVQMFLSLPPALAADVGHPAGILWTTADSPLSIEEIGRQVSAAFPDLTYKNDYVKRALTDVRKHNKAVFPIQTSDGGVVFKPETPYPEIFEDPENAPGRKGKKEEEQAVEEVEAPA